MILADTYAQSRLAALAVGVKYEELPAILTCAEAIEQGSFHPYQKFIRCGMEIDEAFAQCDHVVEGFSAMGGQEHFYLETNATVVNPRGDDEFEVFTGTQNVSQSLFCYTLFNISSPPSLKWRSRSS